MKMKKIEGDSLTPIAVFIKRDGRLALQSWHPESSLSEVRERTGFEFDASGAGPTEPPTEQEARAVFGIVWPFCAPLFLFALYRYVFSSVFQVSIQR